MWLGVGGGGACVHASECGYGCGWVHGSVYTCITYELTGDIPQVDEMGQASVLTPKERLSISSVLDAILRLL